MRIVRVLSFAPLAGPASLFGFVAWVWLHDGRADPKLYPLGWLIVLRVFSGTVLLLPTWGFLVRLEPDPTRREALSRRFWLSWALWSLYAAVDPGDFVQWYMD